MDAAQSQESATRALIASAKELDPDSPEFYDACQALIKHSAGRRLQGVGALRSEVVETSPVPDAQSETSEPYQRPTPASNHEADTAALREARRREGEARADVQTLQTELHTVRAQVQSLQSELQAVQTELETRQAELVNVKARYNETLTALEAASERASHSRIEFGNAMSAIAERDAAINEMRQLMADQDREINELQRLLIQAEEARISDASAILDSLDKYRG
ncbi:hypothetical protein [Aeromicrobium sp.]|uniref:hypothetical protein n=1 Tax=Aeromicrobium sp. TaxID=1871063 RepID=UPI002FC6EABE